MHVASLELCRELFELSGWDDCESHWKYGGQTWHLPADTKPIGENDNLPLYDLGYLLRKLPKYTLTKFVFAEDKYGEPGWTLGWEYTDGSWKRHQGDILFVDTPEDALCKLAIELIKQNILPTERSTHE